MPFGCRSGLGVIVAVALALAPAVGPARAQGATSENKPYDDRLMRLCEILGAVHYLRELCGSTDGQLWREKMQELINAEGSTALRKAKLTRSFNHGYRSYARTYNACTPSAQTAMTRFITEGAQISENLARSIP